MKLCDVVSPQLELAREAAIFKIPRKASVIKIVFRVKLSEAPLMLMNAAPIIHLCAVGCAIEDARPIS